MPDGRPAIPADVERKVYMASGHRCAVCGGEAALEIAHIEKWSSTRSHDENNLIFLCASCHARADREKWGTKTLRAYKRQPHFRGVQDPKPRVVATIRIPNLTLSHYGGENGDEILRFALGKFLGIEPREIEILEREEGSVLITVKLPVRAAKGLCAALEANDPKTESLIYKEFDQLRRIKRAVDFTRAQGYCLLRTAVYPPVIRNAPADIRMDDSLSAELGFVGDAKRLLALETNRVFALEAPNRFTIQEMDAIETVGAHLGKTCEKLIAEGRLRQDAKIT